MHCNLYERRVIYYSYTCVYLFVDCWQRVSSHHWIVAGNQYQQLITDINQGIQIFTHMYTENFWRPEALVVYTYAFLPDNKSKVNRMNRKGDWL